VIATDGLKSSVKVLKKIAKSAEFTTAGTIITHEGFSAVYGSKSNDDVNEFPKLKDGDALKLDSLGFESQETKPPHRYSEAGLIKKLEELGIGRPSTYASTIQTIINRGYTKKRGLTLIPTYLAFPVIRLLRQNFPTYLEYEFTAKMEEDLDKIAEGKENRTKWLKGFYSEEDGLRRVLLDYIDTDPRTINTFELGEGYSIRIGQYGPFIERIDKNGKRLGTGSIPEDVDPSELTLEVAKNIIEAGQEDSDRRLLGVNPATNGEVFVTIGKFGPYIQEVEALPEKDADGKTLQPKRKNAPLLSSVTYTDVTLESALKSLALPRKIGKTEDGADIMAQKGRFGPYISTGTDTRSLIKDDDIFTLTEEEARKLFATPKASHFGRNSSSNNEPPLRVIGKDPETGDEIVIKNGRFGAYLTDGKVNRSIPSSETAEKISPEKAFKLMSEKRAAGPTKRTRRGFKRR
jgi:DNA topoisomerase-1